MSGGRFDYMYSQIQNMYEGSLEDYELEELLRDFTHLLHDLEWYRSGDYGADDYKTSVKEFKKKWFAEDNRTERLTQIIEYKTDQLKRELLQMIDKQEGK